MTARAALAIALVLAPLAAAAQPAAPRPRVGVAFGGGSARGIAHIGVIQWFEENHIPIDTAAGTSMGGLIGGAFATGRSAAELRELVTTIDWDMMFGSSSFGFKNVRRKEDARSYPSRLEFGLKRGIVPPTALNDGQQVDLLLARLTAPYYNLARFDDLPTPFRVVAVDLLAGEKVVIDSGSLASALRATMSLPAVFPPVDRDGRVLVDGGALDNIPADVVRTAGADVVIAVDVGQAPADSVDYSLFGLLGQTVDAMMRNSTRASLASADLTLQVDVTGLGSLDWRRADELIARGYQAAERHRDELLRHRATDAQWSEWMAQREGRRRRELPRPTFLTTQGIVTADETAVRRALTPHLNAEIDIAALDRDLAALSGLDRYQTVTWQIVEEQGRSGLLIRAQEKRYAPPYLMLGLNIENTSSEDFRVRLAARYLTFDVLGSGSELRVDGVIGADPSVGAAIYKPLARSPLFARGLGTARKFTFDVVKDGATVAQYRERRYSLDGYLGVNLSRESEVSGGFAFAHLDDAVVAGDPGLPQLSGKEVTGRLLWVLDQQDSPVVPSHGTRAIAELIHLFDSPEVQGVTRANRGITQFEFGTSSFWSAGRRNRLFVVTAGGTSFDDQPLPTRQFTPGRLYVLDAFAVGERRGDHFGVITAGAARQIARLPDFLGGAVFASMWLENGTVFNSHEDIDLNSQIGAAIILDTLIGPVIAGASAGLDGGWRTHIGIGRIFR